jgi:hypothetical protein
MAEILVHLWCQMIRIRCSREVRISFPESKFSFRFELRLVLPSIRCTPPEPSRIPLVGTLKPLALCWAIPPLEGRTQSSWFFLLDFIVGLDFETRLTACNSHPVCSTAINTP